MIDLEVFSYIGLFVVVIFIVCIFMLISSLFQMFWVFLLPCRCMYRMGDSCSNEESCCYMLCCDHETIV